jgi:hypothetical protein
MVTTVVIVNETTGGAGRESDMTVKSPPVK